MLLGEVNNIVSIFITFCNSLGFASVVLIASDYGADNELILTKPEKALSIGYEEAERHIYKDSDYLWSGKLVYFIDIKPYIKKESKLERGK